MLTIAFLIGVTKMNKDKPKRLVNLFENGNKYFSFETKDEIIVFRADNVVQALQRFEEIMKRR